MRVRVTRSCRGQSAATIGIVRQGLRDISISRTSISWGIPVPWDPSVFYVWYGAAHQLRHRGRLARTVTLHA